MSLSAILSLLLAVGPGGRAIVLRLHARPTRSSPRSVSAAGKFTDSKRAMGRDDCRVHGEGKCGGNAHRPDTYSRSQEPPPFRPRRGLHIVCGEVAVWWGRCLYAQVDRRVWGIG